MRGEDEDGKSWGHWGHGQLALANTSCGVSGLPLAGTGEKTTLHRMRAWEE